MRDFLQGLAAGAMGIFFGFAMEKGRVFEPMVIRDQMTFSKFIMLKMFLSAVVAGQIGMLVVNYLSPKRFQLARSNFASCINRRGIIDVAIGGTLLGAGMTIAGACPGMVVIQAASFVENSFYTLAGLFLGAYIYAHYHHQIEKHFHQTHYKKNFIDNYLSLPLPMLMVLCSALFVAVILTVEYFFPWESELPRPNDPSSSFFNMHAWSPLISGAVIGALQIPAIVFQEDTLGSSSSYMTVCSLAAPNVRGTSNMYHHLQNFKTGMGNWWQPFYLLGAAAGAFLSAELGMLPTDVSPHVPGVSPLFGFIGGILMMIGSRIAGGCTSGHGLSGMGLLAIRSFTAVPMMFAGAMGTAAIMKYLR